MLISPGAHTFRQLPLLVDHVFDLEGNPGFSYHIYDIHGLKPPQTVHNHKKSELSLLDEQMLEQVKVELIGTFYPPETTSYYITLSSLGPAKIVVDGQVVLEQTANCSDAMGFLFGGVPVPKTSVPLEAGRAYKICIHAAPPAPGSSVDLGFLQGQVGVRACCMPATEHDSDVLSEAVNIARTCDYSIIFTGNDPDWETEGQDQASFNLPKDGSQDALVNAVADVCATTIVVNSTGTPVALPWLHKVDALLQVWFPGQEAGNSIVDVLTGAQNPEGHLTCTFPKRLEDCPAYGNFPGQKHDEHGLEVRYEEGIFMGYRHFDLLPADKVNFPFGFGLSYTTFAFEDFNVEGAVTTGFAIKLNVRNTGPVCGAIAAQVYVGKKDPPTGDPVKVLAAFQKVFVKAGSACGIEMFVDTRDIATWDEVRSVWLVTAGKYDFSVGTSAGDLVTSRRLTLSGCTFAP